MPITKYTTQVSASKTVGEIQEILAKHGVTKIMTEYDIPGVTAMSFTIMTNGGELGYRLPVNPSAVLSVMKRDPKCPQRLCNEAQALRVSWRIVKQWIDAQMAFIETGQATVGQVFLAYALSADGKTTLYEHLEGSNYNLLTQGQDIS